MSKKLTAKIKALLFPSNVLQQILSER